MEDRFNQDDIGKRVSVQLEIEPDSIARALGASNINVCGKLIRVKDGHFILEVTRGHHHHRSKKEERIEYEAVKSYQLSKIKYI